MKVIQMNKVTTNEKKVFKQLHEWAGNSNFGITGLGIHPDILPISMVRPDVFHLCIGVTKRLLKHTNSTKSLAF